MQRSFCIGLALFSPLDVYDGTVGKLHELTFEDVVCLADAHLLIAHLGGHHLSGGRLRDGSEQQRGVGLVLDPVAARAEHVVGLLLHGHDLAAHQSAAGHQGRGQMLDAVVIELRRDALHLHHIGHLRHGPLCADAVIRSQQLPAHQGRHRQNQNHGDHIHHIEFSNTLCFLFHGLLRDGPRARFFFLWTMYGKHCIILSAILQR